MLIASLTLFVLSILLPNLVLAKLKSEQARKRYLAYLPNLMFVLVLGSFMLGVAHVATIDDAGRLGWIVYLAFEALVLASTLILFFMKERYKKRLQEQAMGARGANSVPEPKADIAARKAATCAPRIVHDTGTQDGETGWTVSSLFSWHVYVYKLQVRFSVSTSTVEVTAEAETYDANWFEFYLMGLGLMVPGMQIVSLIGAGSIAASHYHAKQTAKGAAICLHKSGACVLIPNADPSIPPARENEVSAGALVVAQRLTPQMVNLTMTGISAMAGHLTVQGITVGGNAGGSTSIGGLPPTSPVGPTSPINLNAGINLNVHIVPSPNALHHLTLGRSVIIECVEETVSVPDSDNGVQLPPAGDGSLPVEEEDIGAAWIWSCGDEFPLVSEGTGNTDAEALQAAIDAARLVAPSQCPTACGPVFVRTVIARYRDEPGGMRRAKAGTLWKCTYP